MTRQQIQQTSTLFYQDSLAHLVDELRQLDARIQRYLVTLHPQRLAAQDMAASKGVYIMQEEVDALLEQGDSDDAQPRTVTSDLQESTIAAKISASAEQGIFLSLPYIARLFSLSPLEVQ